MFPLNSTLLMVIKVFVFVSSVAFWIHLKVSHSKK